MAAQLQGLPAAPGLVIGPAVALRRAVDGTLLDPDSRLPGSRVAALRAIGEAEITAVVAVAGAEQRALAGADLHLDGRDLTGYLFEPARGGQG